jgi:hypothetical protein
MLPPRWFRLRIGPYLRREADKRRYHRYFVRPSVRSLLTRELRLALGPRFTEQDRESAVIAFKNSKQPEKHSGVVQFEGMVGLFSDLIGHHAQLREALTQMTRPAVRPDIVGTPHIAVHVRRGDFTVPQADDVTRGLTNRQLDIHWYVSALRKVRGGLPGTQGRTLVYSDGTDAELAPLLSEPEVTRVAMRPAITHVLAMADAQCFIASGSTFSMWASFLGQMPTIWFPGQRRQLLRADQVAALEPEWQSGDLPADFHAAVAKCFTD